MRVRSGAPRLTSKVMRRPPARRRRDRRAAAQRSVLLCLTLFAAGATAALTEDGPVRYRDPVFRQVERSNDIVYGRAIDIPSAQPVDLRLDLYQPRGDTDPARAVLLFVHGGGFVGGDKSAGQRWADEFARRGWVVVSIQYRLRQGDVATVGISAAVADARQALRWLRREAATYRLDPTRIVVGGSSAGGITALFLTYTELATEPADAASTVAGVMDLWGALYDQEAEMTAGEPPLVIVHGTEDTVVPYRYAEALRDRAEAVGIPHAFHPLEGVGHGSRETAQISAWAAEFFYPLLWPAQATPPVDPTPGATVTIAPSPSPTAPATASGTIPPPDPPSATPSPPPTTASPPPTAPAPSIRVYLPLLLDVGTFRAHPPTTAPTASPPTTAPIHGAALMSGACVASTLDRAETNGVAVATELGCAGSGDVAACLRGKTTAEVMATLDPMGDGTDTLGPMTYDGVIDDYLLPDAPRAPICARSNATSGIRSRRGSEGWLHRAAEDPPCPRGPPWPSLNRPIA